MCPNLHNYIQYKSCRLCFICICCELFFFFSRTPSHSPSLTLGVVVCYMSAFNIIFTGLGKLSVWEWGKFFFFHFLSIFLAQKLFQFLFNTLLFRLRNSFYTNDYSNMMWCKSHYYYLERQTYTHWGWLFLAQFC